MGSLAIFVRNVHSDPVTVTFLRLSLGALFLLPLSRKPVISPLTVGVGILNLLTIVCYISAIEYSKVAVAALLLYMAPVYVTIYVLITEGSVAKGAVVAIPASLLGLYLMLSPSKIDLGEVYGILSGLFYAALFVVMKRARESVPSIPLTFTSLLIGSLVLLPFVRSLPTPNELPWVVGLGLFPTALAFTVFSYGIKFCKTEIAPILSLLEPVSASFFGYAFFGETLRPVQVLGAILIMSGVAVSQVE